MAIPARTSTAAASARAAFRAASVVTVSIRASMLLKQPYTNGSTRVAPTCLARAGCSKSPATTNYERVADKAALVKALNESLAFCDGIYDATTDANFNQPVTLGPLGPMQAAITAV